jgi:hypothetical protein
MNIEYQSANQNLLNWYERINKNHSFLINLLIRNTSLEASKIIKGASMMDITDIIRLKEKLLDHQWFFERKDTPAPVITNDTQLIHTLANLLHEQFIEIMNLNGRLEEYEGDDDCAYPNCYCSPLCKDWKEPK